MKIDIKNNDLRGKLMIALFSITLLIIVVFFMNIVSSITVTCLETKNNSICQEFDSGVCDSE